MATLRQTGFRLVSVFLGLLMGLALAEVATRLFALSAPLQKVLDNFVVDPRLPFKPRPFSRVVGQTAEFSYDYQHNSLGLRDVEHQVEKPAGAFRLLGLGDSFTYGIGAPQDGTYLARLEAELNQRPGGHPTVEIIKAGVPRYFPEPERILLEEYGLQFHPDLIVVGILPNDVVDTYLGLDAVTVDTSGFLRTREAKQLGRLGSYLYRYSHLGRLALRAYVDRRSRPRERELHRDGGFHERDWRKMEAEFSRMVAIGDSIGARVLLVHIPQQGPWSAEDQYLPTRFSAWALAHHALFLDVLPAMQARPDAPSLYYPDDGHCTPAGYAVVADTLFQFLTVGRVVP